jgi:PAS domain S-box-containing protein
MNMKDESKTKKQLIDELFSLRQQVAKLEESEKEYRQILPELQMVRKRFDLLLLATSDAIHDWDVLKNQLWCNVEMQKVMGVKEIVDDPWNWWISRLHPDDRDRMAASMERFLKSDKEFGENEYRIQRPDGEYAYILHRIYILRDHEGKPVRMMGAASNITKRKQVEDVLRQSEERYRTIIENVEDGYYEVDLKGELTFLNDRVVNNIGYSRDEMLGNPYYLFSDKENAAKVFQIFNNVYNTGIPVSGIDWIIQKKDGTKAFVEASVSLIKDAEGKPAGFRGIVHDVTARKKAEQCISDALQFNQTILAASPVGILTYNSSGQCVSANEAASKIVGGTIEELLAQDFHYIESWKRSGMLETAENALTKEQAQVLETHLVTTFGKDRWFFCRFTPFHHEGLLHLLLLISDITERKRIEETLIKSEARLMQAQAMANLGSWEIDLTNRMMWGSEEAFRIYGIEYTGSASAFLPMAEIQKANHPEDRQRMDSALRALLKEKKRYDLEFRIFRVNDGELRVIHSQADLLYSEKGLPLKVFGTLQDITERKQAEEALRQSENWYRTIFENTGTATVILEEDTTIALANTEFEKLSGFAKDEIEGKMSWTEFVVKEDLDWMVEKHRQRRIDREAVPKQYEFRFRDRSANIRHIFLKIDMIPGTNRSVASLMDITERKQAELQSLLANERVKYLLSETSAVIYSAKTSGDYGATFITDNVTQMTGYSPQEFINDSRFWLDHIHPDDVDRILGELPDIFERNHHTYEYRFRCKDGKYIWVIDEMRLVRNENRNPLEIIGFWLDITDRKQAEEALRESEEKYSAVARQAKDGVILIQDNILKFVNEAMADILGYKPGEMENTPYINYVAHESRAMVATRVNARLAGEDVPQFYEAKLLRKDGIIINAELSANVIQLSGKPADVGVIRDVTYRKRAEEELKRYSVEIADLYHNAPCGYHSLGPDGTFLRINDTELRWIGYTRDEVIGKKKWSDLLTPESLILFHENFPVFKKQGWINNLEFNLIRKDGTTLPVLLNATAIKDADDNYIMSRSTIIDNTERKQAEAELLRLVTAMEQAAEGIYLTDINWIIQYANPAFEKMLGYDKGEIIGWHARLLKSGKHDRIFYQNIRETLVSGKVWSGRGINKKKDGTFIDADVTMSPVRDRSGKIINYVCIHRDITHEIVLEAQLLQSQKMEAVGTLAGGIAHDFNNLLSAIVGHVTLLKMEASLDNSGMERLEHIEELVESGATMARQLLGFARKGRIDVKPADMNQLLDRLVTMFWRTKREITIHKKFEEKLWATEVDSGQIEQVFMNLFVNAWQAMPGGGNIYLETSNMTIREPDYDYMVPGNYVKISVTDTGIGMDEATKARLFEPFFTTKEIGRGTGLGLATVYGIIKGHDGYINVYSEKGQGTTFNIYLPYTEKEASEERKKPGKELVRGKESILLIDDEEEIVRVLEQMLEQLGYSVLVARSGQEGLMLYTNVKNKVDLVILDMIMPGMGGGETFNRLREMNPDIKVILSSGYSIDGDAMDIMNRGCKGFIQKPVKFTELSQKVREVLEKKD